MKNTFSTLILILLGFNSVVSAQSSLPKCEETDSSQWSKCFGTERIEGKIDHDSKGTYVGIGIEVAMEAEVIKVISPIDDTPASRAGIKAGDYIVRIDGNQVEGKTLMEAVYLLRGPAGIPIEITITRKGEKKSIELKIVREIIQTTFKRAKYEGEYKNGKFHGHGTYTGKYGDNYVGQFKNGEFSGQGTYTWAAKERAKYVGRFKNDKYHGQGIYTFADGAKYVGRFKDGKFYGQGTYTGADGRRYIGGWKDNKFHGQGIFNYLDGRIEEGIWKYGRLVK